MTSRSFPANFLWGAATAGHQIEGNNDNSDIWFLENVEPTVFRERSGLACNSFELWETDLDLVAGLGANAYRFSVEWARIEPEPGVFSADALAHYAAIVDGCVARGLAPVVTFNHFACPHWFASRGGFAAEGSDVAFALYCEQIMRTFGDRISHAITFNEPNLHRLLPWLGLPDFVRDLERATLQAASESAGVDAYRVGNVVVPEDYPALQVGYLAAHQAGKAVIKSYRPDLPVGLSIAITDDCAIGDDTSVVDEKRADVYDFWLDVASGDDFIGVQNYERRWFDGEGQVDAPDDLPKNDMGSAVEPESLAECVAYCHQRSGVPVFVTEHGMQTTDDSLRAGFITDSLIGLADQITDNDIPVIGYLHWTLIDNFEWIAGFHGQLGLHAIDRATYKRSRKPSADVFERIVRSNAVRT